MFRPSAFPRMFVGLALTAAVGTGIGLAVAGLGPFSEVATPLAPHTLSAAASTADAPGTNPAPTSGAAQLTADQATAVALQASPGTVVDVQQDNNANDANEPSDPNEASDPTEGTDPNETAEADQPTGLEYEVTVLHSDGTATEVVVGATTGQVVSTTQKDDWNGN